MNILIGNVLKNGKLYTVKIAGQPTFQVRGGAVGATRTIPMGGSVEIKGDDGEGALNYSGSATNDRVLILEDNADGTSSVRMTNATPSPSTNSNSGASSFWPTFLFGTSGASLNSGGGAAMKRSGTVATDTVFKRIKIDSGSANATPPTAATSSTTTISTARLSVNAGNTVNWSNVVGVNVITGEDGSEDESASEDDDSDDASSDEEEPYFPNADRYNARPNETIRINGFRDAVITGNGGHMILNGVGNNVRVNGNPQSVANLGSGDVTVNGNVQGVARQDGVGSMTINGNVETINHTGTGDITIVDGTAGAITKSGCGNITVHGDVTGDIMNSGVGDIIVQGSHFGRLNNSGIGTTRISNAGRRGV